MKKKKMSRSENMAKVKNKDTKPEMIVRRLLHGNGYRYRLHKKDLPGKPDIYIGKYKTAVFINGCFWHAHADCIRFTIPKTNTEFWNAKLMNNRERDYKVYDALIKQGHKVIVVWECTVSDCLKDDACEDILLGKLKHALHSDQSFMEL